MMKNMKQMSTFYFLFCPASYGVTSGGTRACVCVCECVQMRCSGPASRGRLRPTRADDGWLVLSFPLAPGLTHTQLPERNQRLSERVYWFSLTGLFGLSGRNKPFNAGHFKLTVNWSCWGTQLRCVCWAVIWSQLYRSVSISFRFLTREQRHRSKYIQVWVSQWFFTVLFDTSSSWASLCLIVLDRDGQRGKPIQYFTWKAWRHNRDLFIKMLAK